MQFWGPQARVQLIGKVNAYEQWVVVPGDGCPDYLATFRAPFNGAGSREKAINYARERFQNLEVIET